MCGINRASSYVLLIQADRLKVDLPTVVTVKLTVSDKPTRQLTPAGTVAGQDSGANADTSQTLWDFVGKSAVGLVHNTRQCSLCAPLPFNTVVVHTLIDNSTQCMASASLHFF